MGWIIAAVIIGLIVLLLAIPIAMHFHRDKEGRVRIWLKYLFLRFLMYDSQAEESEADEKKKSKKGKTTKSSKQKKSDDAQSDDNQKKKSAVSEILDMVKMLAPPGARAFGIVLRRMHFYDIEISWNIGREDPYETGMAYGRTLGWVYPVLGFLCSRLRMKVKRLEILPDFISGKDAYALALKARITPAAILRAAAAFGIEMLKSMAHNQMQQTSEVRAKPAVQTNSAKSR